MTKIALAPSSRRPREQAGACSTAILALSGEHSPSPGIWGGKERGGSGPGGRGAPLRGVGPGCAVSRPRAAPGTARR